MSSGYFLFGHAEPSHSHYHPHIKSIILYYHEFTQADAIQLIVLSLTLPMAGRALFGSLSFNITFVATEFFKVIYYRIVHVQQQETRKYMAAGQSATSSQQNIAIRSTN